MAKCGVDDPPIFRTGAVVRRRDFLAGMVVAAGVPAPLAAQVLPLYGTSHEGKPIAMEDVPGWKLVYFGYTQCPDICPMGLQNMADALAALGPLGERITPVFISVDPERDTPAILKDFVSYFHPRTVGIAPSPAQLQALAPAWRIKYARAETGQGRPYAVDHTSTIILVHPSGLAVGRFSHTLEGKDLADRVRAAVLKR